MTDVARQRAEGAKLIAEEVVAGRHFFTADTAIGGLRCIAIDDARQVSEALLAVLARVDTLEGIEKACNVEIARLQLKRAEYKRRVDALEQALRELADACEAEFMSSLTEGLDEDGELSMPDDEQVAYPNSHITFGMIRRALAVASGETPQP